MKKAFLACLFMFSCTLIPVSADTTINEDNNAVEYMEDGTPVVNIDELKPSTNIDLSNGIFAQPSLNPIANGDIIYSYSYLTVPARKSVNLGLINFAYSGDRLRIAWSGATNYNPQMDIVIAYSNGTQYSVYESQGILINNNTGSLVLKAGTPGNVHIWFRSLNYSDVVFYSVELQDAAY